MEPFQTNKQHYSRRSATAEKCAGISCCLPDHCRQKEIPKRVREDAFLLIFLCLISMLFLQCETPKQEALTQVWPEIKSTTKPWTRWWWMGNAVDKKNIDIQLKALSAAGFGGVEITPIYGVKGYEDRYIDFLSDEWMDILQFTITKAEELGMGVDMNLGTGWPFGGPQITSELAASKLLHERFLLRKGEKSDEKIICKDPKQSIDDVALLALTAYFDDGRTMDLTDLVNDDNELDWIPGEDCEVIAAFNGKTRQKVKRAAPGGEGWSMDHFSREALEVYLARFDSAFSGITKRPRAFFNDSFEVYGSSGTQHIFEEFEKRRGYDLKPYLKELFSEDDTEKAKRIQSDYRQTFGELLSEEFTQPWTVWSNEQNVLSRNQAHGSPANIIDLYGTVDIPECETFGSSYFPIPGLRRDSADIRPVDPDPIMMKFAVSAGNAYGKDYISSETFTWLAEHFRVSLSQCKPELEQVFLAGVNHVFYHGTTYSPAEAAWPGWLFYASVQFGPVNSFWPHAPGLNEYVARCQSVLQKGRADSDVLVYWPIYDAWNNTGRLDQQISIHNIDEWLHPTEFYSAVKKLSQMGYLADFASDNMIENIRIEDGKISVNGAGSKYKTLIIPSCELMPVATLKKILEAANAGATVIFESMPRDVPGFGNLTQERIEFREALQGLNFEERENLGNAAEFGKGHILQSQNPGEVLNILGIRGESLVASGLKFIRRIDGEDTYYYLVNHTAGLIEGQIPLNTSANKAIIMNPYNGNFGRTTLQKHGEKRSARIHLESGQTIIIRCTDKDISHLPTWKYVKKYHKPIELTGPWELSFTNGGPEIPEPAAQDRLKSWTELPDEKAVNFSGQGLYEYNLTLSEDPSEAYILDLGSVRESARVWVNDYEVGLLWSLPFKLRINDYLKKGENTIKVEVANLMANRIRYMDRQGIEWRIFREINFVNIDYKPFDASNWLPMPSGLLGPVTLTAVDLE